MQISELALKNDDLGDFDAIGPASGWLNLYLGAHVMWNQLMGADPTRFDDCGDLDALYDGLDGECETDVYAEVVFAIQRASSASCESGSSASARRRRRAQRDAALTNLSIAYRGVA